MTAYPMVAFFFGYPLSFTGTLQSAMTCFKLTANLKVHSLNQTDLS